MDPELVSKISHVDRQWKMQVLVNLSACSSAG